MARAMWKGAIQFGLVTIPIRLYLATDSKGISFNMLHETDLSRIQMKIWCPVEEKVIPRSDTVRGYEWAPDQYVVITDEDLESVPLKTVRSIEIEQFVARDGATEDGPVRFAKQAYYVEPEKIGQKAFYLLREVLEEKGLTAICKVVIKDREALAKLDPFADTMLMTTLHWPDEIRAIGELDLPAADQFQFKPAEKRMAEQLVEAMTGEFDAAQYHDEYRDALMAVIQAKVEGHEVVASQPEPETNLVDLMAALQASVNAAKEARGSKPTSVAEARKAREATGGRKARERVQAEEEPAADAKTAPGGVRSASGSRSSAGTTARARSAGEAARGEHPEGGPAERATARRAATSSRTERKRPSAAQVGGAGHDEDQAAEVEPPRRRKSA